MEMSNKKELIVFGVCMVLVGLFIFVLPRLNDVVRDKNNLEEELNKPEPIPVSYHCKMSWDNEDYGYILNQDATYTIDENEKVVKAVSEQSYQFETKEGYERYQKERISNEKIEGIEQKVTYLDEDLIIQIYLTRVIDQIPEDKLDSNFPKTYDNLLIYTKDQDCEVTYKSE